jgi:hypothetical protein
LYRDLCAATDALGANAKTASATAAATIPTFEPMVFSLILLTTLHFHFYSGPLCYSFRALVKNRNAWVWIVGAGEH